MEAQTHGGWRGLYGSAWQGVWGEQGSTMQCPECEQKNQVNTLPIAVRLLKYRCYVGKTVKTP